MHAGKGNGPYGTGDGKGNGKGNGNGDGKGGQRYRWTLEELSEGRLNWHQLLDMLRVRRYMGCEIMSEKSNDCVDREWRDWFQQWRS